MHINIHEDRQPRRATSAYPMHNPSLAIPLKSDARHGEAVYIRLSQKF